MKYLVSFPDRVLPDEPLFVLHRSLWHLGDCHRPTLPHIPSLGSPGATGECDWRGHRHSPARLFLVRNRHEHRRAYLTLRQVRNEWSFGNNHLS